MFFTHIEIQELHERKRDQIVKTGLLQSFPETKNIIVDGDLLQEDATLSDLILSAAHADKILGSEQVRTPLEVRILFLPLEKIRTLKHWSTSSFGKRTWASYIKVRT